jgi:hypothetical protein
MHFYTHGGKTGRAMIKYPHTKKNAQRSSRALYQVWAKSIVRPGSSDLKNLHSGHVSPHMPRLATAPVQCIITCMSKSHYYYVMCQRGSLVHRAYVRLDPASADILHDSLESRSDLVQVCAVEASEVEWDLFLDNAP